MRQLQQKMDKLMKHVNIHLERTDKKTSVTSVTLSEIRSQIHRLEATIEGNFEHIPEPDQSSWVFPSDIAQIHALENDTLLCEEFKEQCLLMSISSKMKIRLQVDSPKKSRTIHPKG